MDNPYRKYDKGMDDAYMGKEPTDTQSQQYMTGYEYAEQLINENNHHENDQDTGRIF